MKKHCIFLSFILFFLSSSVRAQTCIGSASFRHGPGVFQWMESAGDNLLICGGVYYTASYTYAGTTITAPAGAYATCYVVMTDTLFNLVRMFNHVSFFRAGGAFNDLRIWNMAVDPWQNILFTGSYTDSMLVYGNDTVFSDKYQEGFVAKSDSIGQPLLLKSFGSRHFWANYRFEDRGHCITTDTAGNIYVGASFEGDYLQVNNDTVHNGTSVGLNSYRQAAVFSLTPGGQTRWIRSFGAVTQDDSPFGIAVDEAGRVTVCGSTEASNQDFRFGSITYRYKSSPSGFQSYSGQFDANGNALWFYPVETYVGSGPDVSAYDVVLDDFGNSYIAGFFDGYAIFKGDTIRTQNYTSSYLLKIDSTGNRVFLRTGNIDTFYPYPLALKIQDDKVFVTGQSYTNNLLFPPYGLCCSREIFFAMYDTSGNVLFLKGASGSGGVNMAGYDVAFTSAGTGVACGGFSGGTITIEPVSATTAGTNYYQVRFGDVASNGLAMTLSNNGSDTIGCGTFTPLQMVATPSANTRFFWWADNDTIPGPFYSANLNATPKFTTTYYALAYNNACTVLDSITVYVTPVPAVAGTDTAVCSGSNLQLSGNVIPGAAYSWQPAAGISNDTIHDPVVTVDSTLQLIYSVTAAGCVNTDTLMISVIPPPVSAFVLSATNLQLNLTAQSQGFTGFLWTFGDGNVDSLNLNPLHTYLTSGTYEVCLETWNECSRDTVCQFVNITNVGIAEINSSILISETDQEVLIRQSGAGPLKVEVIDLSGKVIYANDFAVGEVLLQKSDFAPGIYILSAANNAGFSRRRIGCFR